MSKFFDSENVVWRAVGRLGDLMILNVIFLLSCIPLVTIGASLTALNYVSMKLHKNEEGYISREFFKSFKQNFKQATIIWLGMVLAGTVIVLDLLVLTGTEGTANAMLLMLNRVLVIPYLVLFLYVFPVLARFENSAKNIVVNAFLMAVLHLPRTILMLLITAFVVVLTFLNAYTMSWGLPIWGLAGFALLSYMDTFFLKGVFRKYIPEEEQEEKKRRK